MKKSLYFKGFLVYQYRGTEVVVVTGVEPQNTNEKHLFTLC